MEVVPPQIEIGDDRLPRPVAVRVTDVAPVALGQQLGVVALALGPGQRVRPDTDRLAVAVVVLEGSAAWGSVGTGPSGAAVGRAGSEGRSAAGV